MDAFGNDLGRNMVTPRPWPNNAAAARDNAAAAAVDMMRLARELAYELEEPEQLRLVLEIFDRAQYACAVLVEQGSPVRQPDHGVLYGFRRRR